MEAATHPPLYNFMNKKVKRMNQIVDAVIQSKFLPVVAGAIGAFFAPIWLFALGVVILVVINRRVGKRAALARKEAITDDKAHRSFSTVLDYTGLIIAGHVFDVWFLAKVPLLQGTELVATIAAMACGSAELAKIARNVKQLRGVKLGKLEKILNNLQDSDEGKEQ